MCLILIAQQVHPDFPLVIAANRDEYFARPTQKAQFWNSAPNLLAGRDLSAGGSWMGITRSGRFAAVTNVRNPQRPAPVEALSRGQLVSDFLLSDSTAADYLASLESRKESFNGYNLICGNQDTLWYGSNCFSAITPLRKGFHGLSNAGLNSAWPKVDQGKTALQHCLAQPDFKADKLLDVLNHRLRAADDSLPDTGVGLTMERILSSRFIRDQQLDYGTRTSTAYTLSTRGEVTFIEWTWNADGELEGRADYFFQLI